MRLKDALIKWNDGKERGAARRLAKATGSQPSYISEVLNQLRRPSREMAEKIGRVVGLTADDVLADTERQPPFDPELYARFRSLCRQHGFDEDAQLRMMMEKWIDRLGGGRLLPVAKVGGKAGGLRSRLKSSSQVRGKDAPREPIRRRDEE